jgi:hypothetical protein
MQQRLVEVERSRLGRDLPDLSGHEGEEVSRGTLQLQRTERKCACDKQTESFSRKMFISRYKANHVPHNAARLESGFHSLPPGLS